MSKLEKCRAPWGCDNPSAKASGSHARHIGGEPYCRVCYQYAWVQAKEQHVGINARAEFVKKLPGPLMALPQKKLRCQGPECEEVLPADATQNERRFVRRERGKRMIAACRGCYQQAWEYGQANNMTIEEAFFKMPPRKRR